MTSRHDLDRILLDLFATDLNVAVPSRDSDLLEEGLLNSVTFVELVMLLEERFAIIVPLDELELDQFRTVARIAAFIDGLMPGRRTVAAA